LTVELLKKSLKYRQIVAQAATVQEEAAEAIVPDAFPDIERIVDTSALVFIRDKEPQTDLVDIKCNVRVTVLYIPEGKNCLCRLEVPIAFTHRVELRGAAQSSDVLCAARVAMLDCRSVNPRKISVKAGIAFNTRAFGDIDGQLTTGISGDDAGSYQILRRSAQSSVIAATAAKNFTLVEELELPSDCQPVKELLKSDVTVNLVDTRQMSNKVVVKGTAVIVSLYENTEEGISRLSQEVPFSQIIDAPGADADMTCRANFELRSFELAPSMDMAGEVKFLTMSLGLCACLEMMAEQEVEVLSDLYSVSNEVMVEIENKTFSARGESTVRHATVKEKIEAGMQVREVLDWAVRVDENADFVAGEPNAVFHTTVSILYTDTDGNIYSLTRRIPVTVELPGYRPGMAHVRVYDISIMPDTSGGIDARYMVEVELAGESLGQLPMVTSAKVGDPFKSEGRDRLSAVLRFTDEGEDLWAVAKCYHTTMMEIQKTNKLEPSAQLERGKLLLIPLKR